MAQVVWSRRALVRLELIRAYIGQFDPDAAAHFATRLIEAGNSLQSFPHRGRPASRGRRELVTVWPYIIRYKVEGGRIVVSDIKHGAQRRD